MSKIDRTYFKWNPGSIQIDIELGDSKETLINKGLIEEIDDDGEICFTGVNGTPWRVNFQDDLVSRIWFNRNSQFKINGIEISGEKYAEIKPVLESTFDSLNSEIMSTEEMKSYRDSNVLYIVCRDFFVTMIGVIKNKA